MGNSFAYLFERFPSFTQTFCFREVEEMFRQKMSPAVWSIRQADEKSAFAPELVQHVQYLPQETALTAQVRDLRQKHRIGSAIWDHFNSWGERGDKTRLYEAACLGLELKRAGIRHVHAHFAGMPARTAWWIKKFYGIGYSFTGHANDIFCETDFPVSMEDLVADARFVVTETDFSRKWLQEKFPAHAGKLFRVYNGIETGKFLPSIESLRKPFDPDSATRSNENPAEDKPRILSVGRYIEKKGLGDLIEACRILDRRGLNFECLIVGEGPLENDLRIQIEQSQLRGKVVLTGPRQEHEVVQLLNGASLFALPCVREADGGSDNLPTVIMEAMACALPIISTPIAGIPEMIEQDVTGILVPEKSPSELAVAITRIFEHREAARKMGIRGRESVLKKFSTQCTTRHLKHLLIRHGQVIPPWKAIKADRPLINRVVQRWTNLGGRKL
jgi:glycosyltransferase involved in cell wall biosynthesis